MGEMGRLLLIAGGVLLVLGAIFFFGGKLGMSRLPGDFAFRRGNFGCFFPLATSIIASILLTLAMWLFRSRG